MKTKNKLKKVTKIQKLKKTRDSSYFYENELYKAYFQHDIAYGDFKGVPRRAASDKELHGKAFNITKNLIYDGYQRGLASLVLLRIQINLLVTEKQELVLETNSKLKNSTSHLLENLQSERYAILLKITFGVLIQQICNKISKYNKRIRFYYVLLMSLVNIYGLLLIRQKWL